MQPNIKAKPGVSQEKYIVFLKLDYIAFSYVYIHTGLSFLFWGKTPANNTD